MKGNPRSGVTSASKEDPRPTKVSPTRSVRFIRLCCLLLEGLADDRPRTELRSDMYVMF